MVFTVAVVPPAANFPILLLTNLLASGISSLYCKIITVIHTWAFKKAIFDIDLIKQARPGRGGLILSAFCSFKNGQCNCTVQYGAEILNNLWELGTE